MKITLNELTKEVVKEMGGRVKNYGQAEHFAKQIFAKCQSETRDLEPLERSMVYQELADILLDNSKSDDIFGRIGNILKPTSESVNEATFGKNLEQPHSNIKIFGWGIYDGVHKVIVDISDRRYMFKTETLPETDYILKRAHNELSDDELDVIGRELTDYIKNYGKLAKIGLKLKDNGGITENESVNGGSLLKPDTLYYLESLDTDEIFAEFSTFDKNKIGLVISNYLIKNPTHSVAQYKVSHDKKYYWDGCIDIFEMNPKTNKPSKVITNGSKDFYKPIVVQTESIETGEPQIVSQSRELVKSESYGVLTDPVSKKKVKCDLGTASLIVQLADSSKCSDETKKKLFALPLNKLVSILWKTQVLKDN